MKGVRENDFQDFGFLEAQGGYVGMCCIILTYGFCKNQQIFKIFDINFKKFTKKIQIFMKFLQKFHDLDHEY